MAFICPLQLPRKLPSVFPRSTPKGTAFREISSDFTPSIQSMSNPIKAAINVNASLLSDLLGRLTTNPFSKPRVSLATCSIPPFSGGSTSFDRAPGSDSISSDSWCSITLSRTGRAYARVNGTSPCWETRALRRYNVIPNTMKITSLVFRGYFSNECFMLGRYILIGYAVQGPVELMATPHS